jgi:hypothetical protein
MLSEKVLAHHIPETPWMVCLKYHVSWEYFRSPAGPEL